jgi:hypothetical protein
MTKKIPRFGALPLLNMPKRSHDAVKPPSRPPRSVVEPLTTITAKRPNYKHFSELCKRVTALKSGWSLKLSDDRLLIKRMKETYLLPEVEIVIDNVLGFTIKLYGCILPENHPLYTGYLRSVTNITVTELIKEIGLCTFRPFNF